MPQKSITCSRCSFCASCRRNCQLENCHNDQFLSCTPECKGYSLTTTSGVSWLSDCCCVCVRCWSASLLSSSSDLLLLWTGSLLALLCLLSSGAIVHHHADHVHPVPRHELRRLLPHAVPHRLWARQGKCEPYISSSIKQIKSMYWTITKTINNLINRTL